MGIETLLFISLAVTFILLIMLVYHFQNKFDALDHRTESLLAIINNMVKELKQIKTHMIEQEPLGPLGPLEPSDPSVCSMFKESQCCFPSPFSFQTSPQTETTPLETMEIHLGNPQVSTHTIFLNEYQTTQLEELASDDDDSDNDDNESDDDDSDDDDSDDDESDALELDTNGGDKIVVSDTEEVDIENDELVVHKINTDQEAKPSYKKMDVNQLRELAIQRELIQEAKKKNYKKAELLSLLETK